MVLVKNKFFLKKKKNPYFAIGSDLNGWMGPQQDVVVTHTTGLSHDVFLQKSLKKSWFEKKNIWYKLKCKKNWIINLHPQ